MFKGSHYYLIRTNPEYRMMCQMEDMRNEMEPAWAQYEEPVIQNTIRITTVLDWKAMELQNRIVKLENSLYSKKKSSKYTL